MTDTELLEQLEAENAQLRKNVVELALQIQALRDYAEIREPIYEGLLKISQG